MCINKKGVIFQMEYIDSVSEILEPGAVPVYFGDLVPSYLEPAAFEDYADDYPDNPFKKPYTFKSAQESEPEDIYEGHSEGKKKEHADSREEVQKISEAPAEEISPAEWEERMQGDGAFLAEETIITHGSG